MKTTKVLISFILCLAILLMCSLDIVESGHDCAGDNCEICIIVAFCHDCFSKVICSSVILLALLVFDFVFRKLICRKSIELNISTPVSEKVKQIA